MAAAIPAIVLRNGTRIDDALGMALEFVEHDGSYQSYDLARVEQDDVLTASDIRVANAMIARMSPRVIADIYARAPVINDALADVPPSASLAAADDAIPWQALEELLRAMDGIPEVRLARQTKVLHKKRPALMPILDSVLEAYLRRVDGLRRTGDAAREQLRRRGIDLTECRLLDLFLWAYSGTYTPLFRRAETGAASDPVPAAAAGASSPAATGSVADTDSAERIDVEKFRDDEEGYLAWLAGHPAGFVFNVNRSPRPNYLILHRATCRTISGRPTRGGPWTGPYIKVCSDDELQIAAWTGKTVGAAPTRCGVCLR